MQTDAKPLSAAVVGTGFMGRTHTEALRRAGVRVAGILGSTPSRSRSIASALALAKGYATFEDVLVDPDVDAVHIVTPNRLHFDMARRALEAGKHVLCEKPLAMSTAETSELVRIAGERPELAAAVNYNMRFYPLCVEARERVGSGELGRVLHASGAYVQDWLVLESDFNWRVLAEEGGELRAVADIGTHWLDLLQWITRLEIESVCADLRTVHPVRQRPPDGVETFQGGAETSDGGGTPVEVDTEDYGALLLRFRGGARGAVVISQVTAGRKNCLRFEIAGSEAALAWNSELPNELWIGHRERANESLLRDPALLGGSARGATEYPGGHNEGFADTFKQCFRAFYAHIADGPAASAPVYPTFADGHREVALCEAVLESFRESRWAKI